MAFTISSFTADSNGLVVSVDWKYENADGVVSNTHVLATPAGDVAIATVTQDVLVTWLTSQLANTAAELDAYLAAEKVRTTYESGFIVYDRETTDAASPYEINPGTPFALEGYYPLYTLEVNANAASSVGTSHSHVLSGVTYYMPNGGVQDVDYFHGTYGAVAGGDAGGGDAGGGDAGGGDAGGGDAGGDAGGGGY